MLVFGLCEIQKCDTREAHLDLYDSTSCPDQEKSKPDSLVLLQHDLRLRQNNTILSDAADSDSELSAHIVVFLIMHYSSTIIVIVY